MPDARNALIAAHLAYARAIAHGYARHHRIPDYAHDDLEQEAVLGLLAAAERWDESTGVPFRLFAAHRIRGAMADWVRAQTHSRMTAPPVHVELGGPMLAEALADADRRTPERATLDRLAARRLLDGPLLPVERHVLIRHHLDGATLLEIGRELGITESRVCQIERGAREALLDWIP